jgi:hypothetical protein
MKNSIHKNASIPNIIVALIIVFEILYIAYGKLSLREYKPKSIFGTVQSHKLKMIFGTVSFYIAMAFIANMSFNINVILCLILLVLSSVLYLEYHLNRKDETLTNLSTLVNIDEIQTGDYILMETPKHIDNYFHLIPVMSLQLYHIGILLKDANNHVYIIECEPIPHDCEYSKTNKNGVMLLPFEKRIQEFDTVYIVKNNIHNYLSNDDVIAFLKKYKDLKYMENDINCIVFLLLFLKEHGLLKHEDVTKRLYVEYPYILDKDNYTVDFDYRIVKAK